MQGIDTQKLEDAAYAVFTDTPVVLAYAFGSRVAGNPRPDSDLDIGYYLPHSDAPFSLREEMLLAARLCQKTRMDVDLRALAEAPLELRGRILEEGKRIYCADPVFRVNLERDTLSRYHDYKDIFLEMHQTRLRNLARGPAIHG